jgi:tetratricopeptide (TPR) repeat protein
MSKLGHTLWQQGRYSDALELQREAEKKLRGRLGPEHQDTLLAMDQLGRTVTKFYSSEYFDEAHELHETAMKGMQKIHGHDHPRTLEAKENLGRVKLLMGHDHAKATELLSDVLEKRRLKLGKDNPFTLLAMVNMAIANCALRQPEDGEKLIQEALPVAEAMFGTKHIATLFGRNILAVTLISQTRYDEAENILVEVSRRQRVMAPRPDVYHPDRLGTLIDLARCYQLQGKTRESIKICDEALKGFASIVRPLRAVHPLAEKLWEARDKMVLHVQAGISAALDVEFPETRFVMPPAEADGHEAGDAAGEKTLI